MSSSISADPRDSHLRTDDLRANLKLRSVHCGAAVLASQFAGAVLGLGTTMALARLLRPADFGLVAMALPAVVMATLLRSFGLDVAIIQNEELDHRRASAVFWLSLKLNVCLVCSLAALAPVLAWFYSEPKVLGVELALAGSVLALCLGAHHEALLKRQMRFGVLSLIGLAAAAAGAITGIALALLGAGSWALVGQMAGASLVQSTLTWRLCRWRPAPHAVNTEMPDLISRAMICYGRNLTASRVLTLSSSYVDRVLVGWVGGPVILGLYENGRRLPFFILDKLYDALFGVAVAGLSRTGSDAAQYRAFSRKAIQLALVAVLPCLAFLMAEAESLALFFLGDQWLPAAPYARLLAAAAFAQSLTRTMQWFYLSRGETARQLRWAVLQTAIMLSGAGLGAWLGGSYGVAVGFTAAACLLPVPAVAYCLRDSPFSPGDYARAAARPVLLSLGAAAVLQLAGPMHLGSAALVYAFAFTVLWMALPGGRAGAREMIRLISQLRQNRP